ncbi:hypothetical protein J4221_07510 [Candidatus Pacearchaeota archaeon]|nr:hypothetical protein [Candidatus Pacearchaeota archaeon]
MSIDSTDEETDIGKLDDLARGLIVRGDYSEALPYLSKILNVLCKSCPENFQGYKAWLDTEDGKRYEKVRLVVENIERFEQEKNTSSSSKEDHLEAYRKCFDVSGAEAAAEYISAQSAHTRLELDFARTKRLSELKEIIRGYVK